MKCEVCGRYITINWGNESVVVCEEHQGHVRILQATKAVKSKEWTEGAPKHVPVEVEATSTNLLSVWWAFTWRYILLMAVAGSFLGLMLNHSLGAFIAQDLLSIESAKHLETVFSFVMAAIFIFISLDRVVGKKIGNVRLVLVSTERTESN